MSVPIIHINLNLSTLDDLERAMDWIEKRFPKAKPVVRAAAANKGRADSIEEVKKFCAEEGIAESDAEWFWFKCEANSWTNGGNPIRNWKATLKCWKAGLYLPSQKRNVAPAPTPIERATRIAALKDEKRYAVGDEARMTRINEELRRLGA